MSSEVQEKLKNRLADPITRYGVEVDPCLKRTIPKLPGYEIIRELGRGGMAVVYLAQDNELKRLVAIKMLLDPEFADSTTLQRFQAEAAAVARLRHPNIVQVYDVGETTTQNGNTVPYMVLEYVEGGTLHKYLHSKTMSYREMAGCIEILAHAMHHAHVQGVVHRDLKPANILLMPAGYASIEVVARYQNSTDSSQVVSTVHHHQGIIAGSLIPKITDFGLAKAIGKEKSKITLTNEGLAVGTPAYMSPEQASGAGLFDVGAATDVYTLGVILYEMMTGRVPFQDPDVLHLLEQVRTKEPGSPRKIKKQIPPDLETICLKCLEKKPERRYSTAQTLADDLKRYLNDEPVRARRISDAEKLIKWARRRPAIASLSVLFLFTLIGGLLASLLLWHTAECAKDNAEHQEFKAEVALTRQKQTSTRLSHALYRSNIAQAEFLNSQSEFTRAQLILKTCIPKENEEDLRGWEWSYLSQQGMFEMHDVHREWVRDIVINEKGDEFVSIGSIMGHLIDRDPTKIPADICYWKKIDGVWTWRNVGLWPCSIQSLRYFDQEKKIVIFDALNRFTTIDAKFPDDKLKVLQEIVNLNADTTLAWQHISGSKHFLMAGKYGTDEYQCWDLNTGESLPPLPEIIREGKHPIFCSEDGSIAMRPAGDEFVFFDPRSGKVVRKCKLLSPYNQEHNHIAMDYEGRQFCVHHLKRHQLAFYDGMDHLPQIIELPPGFNTHAMKYNRQGDKVLMTDHENLTVMGKARQSWTTFLKQKTKSYISRMDWDSDGIDFYTVSAERSIYRWNSTNGAREELRGHPLAPTALAIQPGGKLMVSGGKAGEIRIWMEDHQPFRKRLSTNLGASEYTSIAGFAENGTKVVRFNHATGQLACFDLATREEKIVTLPDAILRFRVPRSDVDLDSDGKHLAVVSRDDTHVHLFATKTAERVCTLDLARKTAILGFSGDGKRLLTAGLVVPPGTMPKDAKSFHIEIWDVETGKKVFDHSNIPVLSNLWTLNRDGSRFYCMKSDIFQPDPVHASSSLMAFDSATGTRIYEQTYPLNWPSCMRISQDDKYVCVASFQFRTPNVADEHAEGVMIFNAETGTKLHGFAGPDSPVSARFQPNGKRLAVAGYDGDPILYDYEKGFEVLNLRSAAPTRINDFALPVCVNFSPDGHKIVCNSWAHITTLWDNQVKPTTIKQRK